MRRFRKLSRPLAGAVLLLTLGASAPLASLPAAAQDWSFDVSPYLWIASVELETSLPAQPAAPSEVSRFETQITAAAMLAARTHWRSVGLLVDFVWVRLDSDAAAPEPTYSAVNLQSDFIHSTAALTYRLPLQGKFQAEPFAGARFWYVGKQVEAAAGTLPAFNASEYDSWVDPVVGADLRYELSRRWSLGLKGDVGGFGVSADIAWEVYGDVTFSISDWCSASLGYRFLRENYDRDRYTFNVDVQGLLIGVGFHF
jgi:hypothetical protein